MLASIMSAQKICDHPLLLRSRARGGKALDGFDALQPIFDKWDADDKARRTQPAGEALRSGTFTLHLALRPFN